MTAKRITSILIFLILVNCVGKEKANDPVEESLRYWKIVAPNDDRMTKEKLMKLRHFT